MTYEKLKRNKPSEKKRIAKANKPKQRYHAARRECLLEIRRLLREINRQRLLMRQAKLTYRMERHDANKR